MLNNQRSSPPNDISLPSPAQEVLHSSLQQHLKQLREENLSLKCLVAEQALYIRELEELFCR